MQNGFYSFLCGCPWVLCYSGLLLQYLNCTLELSKVYFHQWVVVRSLFWGKGGRDKSLDLLLHAILYYTPVHFFKLERFSLLTVEFCESV